MAELPMNSVVSIIQQDIRGMLKGNTNISKFTLSFVPIGRRRATERVDFQIELSSNPIKKDSTNASIVVDGYCYIAEGTDHKVKFSIYAPQCLQGKRFNQDAPPRHLTVHWIVAKKGANRLSFPQIAEIENKLDSDFCQAWLRTVGRN